MASSYTGLGTELMTTGENAGTWGSTTNTNLQIIEQISGGYTAQSIAGGVQTTTLSVSDGSTGAVLGHGVHARGQRNVRVHSSSYGALRDVVHSPSDWLYHRCHCSCRDFVLFVGRRP